MKCLHKQVTGFALKQTTYFITQHCQTASTICMQALRCENLGVTVLQGGDNKASFVSLNLHRLTK